MTATAVTTKGQVTIPQDVRRKLGIRQGSRIEFLVVGEHAELHVVGSPIEVQGDGFGLLKSRKKSVPADFDVATLAAGEGKRV